ncbi:hypothetical protein NC651_016634 [Populus alba x Populus x berolinensis]|nr:hypothetical protein NC651_016634 [Populus alba x Populus x berolinensis]
MGNTFEAFYVIRCVEVSIVVELLFSHPMDCSANIAQWRSRYPQLINVTDFSRWRPQDRDHSQTRFHKLKDSSPRPSWLGRYST